MSFGLLNIASADVLSNTTTIVTIIILNITIIIVVSVVKIDVLSTSLSTELYQ